MSFYNKAIERYSVREYDTNKKITDEDYNKIINVIKSAPTSSNWHSSSVIVIRDREILNKLGETSKYTGAIKSCDMFLVFLADYNRMNIAKLKHPELQYNSHSSESYTVAVGDAFIQATMAQDIATDLGLGTCFIGLVRTIEKEIIDLLNIKGQAFPVVGLTIGHRLNDGHVKPKLNRVYENFYDYNNLNHEVEQYDTQLIKHLNEISPDKKAFSYTEATIKSASSYRMDTDLIEEIWNLELVNNK
ncbi:nitroreductase family protein [Mycoplasma zalophidermidis]|uniref:Nitroreductase family protein n=1 Tax=Mycoplasma zalophidermidis TaxID=398174 RepID=A0ABS6DR09_9MOLU|nr:nitroreductase family protein [Mycoplasma zalophidermidis]MBU4693416.1 nitroreductase family protein [Mycoplasma zalophidermidis]MCR8966287.1 nitroreductase family protein [Mycoplasma zalophidermidis]